MAIFPLPIPASILLCLDADASQFYNGLHDTFMRTQFAQDCISP